MAGCDAKYYRNNGRVRETMYINTTTNNTMAWYDTAYKVTLLPVLFYTNTHTIKTAHPM